MTYRMTAIATVVFSFILTGAAQTHSQEARTETRPLIGAFAPSRVTEARTETNGRIVETRVVESPSVNGGWKLVTATERETLLQNGIAVHVQERVFVSDASGRRRLSQITETHALARADGEVQTIRTVSVADGNGRLQTVRRELQNVVPVNASVSRTTRTIYLNNGNGFAPVEEIEQIEERRDGGALEVQRTRRTKDVNGRFVTAEVTQESSQRAADGALTSEQTVLRSEPGRDPRESGLFPAQKTVTKTWKDVSGEERRVVQTYSTQIPGVVSSRELKLQEQISAGRDVMPDGSTRAIEQVDQQSAIAPNEGLRLKAQVIELTLPSGTGELHTKKITKSFTSNGTMEPVSVTETHGPGTAASREAR